MKKMHRVLSIAIMFLLGVMIWSGYQLFKQYQSYESGSQNYEALEHSVTAGNSQAEKTVDMDETIRGRKTPITVDFTKLKERKEGEKIKGWLYIEALDISYPILQAEDNSYFLHRNLDGNYEYCGSVFMDAENSSEFTDGNTIVFGHNMEDGSMFGRLKEFSLNNAMESSPYIWIVTEKKELCYQIFSVQIANVTSECYKILHDKNHEFVEFLERMQQSSIMETGDWKFTGQDKVLTLSTCNGDGNSDSRYVIQAVKCN